MSQSQLHDSLVATRKGPAGCSAAQLTAQMPRHGQFFNSHTLHQRSKCVWCCFSGELAPHVLENKALFDRFGVPSDLLLQDLTFEDEQAKKVSPN